jgi:hypothetical protein
LKVGTNYLLSVVKKKVVVDAALVSSIEAFPTTGLATSWRYPWRQWLVSLAGRWGNSAGTLA